MIKLKINNREIQVEEGTSVMKAAQQAGIDVPNLCWHDELEHFTSCMLCLVKDGRNGKLIPSCSIEATNGMDVITDDDEVAEARKTALELLLSEHVGDCEAPCQVACPAHMNIPLMNRLIAAGKFDESLEAVKRDIALPAVLGRICPAPCEGACHRKTVDEPVSICMLKRFVGDKGTGNVIAPAEETEYKVAVIGAGPAGLAAAYYLRLRGIKVTLFDKADKAGGQLRTEISSDILPPDVLDKEIAAILQTGVNFQGGKSIDAEMFAEIRKEFNAVVVASGTIGDESSGFGLKATPKGFVVDKNSYQTSIENVFAIGNALRTSRLAVRSVGQGKEVAFSVWQYLCGQPVKGESRIFNSRFGKLVSEEFSEFMKESAPAKRNYPDAGGDHGFSAEEAVAEAKRCLHCDCRAIDDCKLRIYSDRYQADQKRFKTSERRKITKLTTHSTLVYEPQKCIKCGICVRLTEKEGEKFGFTYVGRGFDVEMGVPFNEELEQGLTETAEKVAKSCPTGAISFKTTCPPE
ncbi:NAD(P)-binding Rossmann-like domain-containing protein [Mariniphaga anaerophila]|uniref:NAD(P)-binding Rossmann-like domain-containing protein n=1 Tax=Mariniphaga anaerophila TaxID=1484053 RepID=A0A1M5DQQ5_9BACT|nr:FAD-dependent oxidoreductase [Mariniphaga anaerophila]SHF69112.1 NAD(P)-binding Rossmann-like domain-containing protein [Mariniphaga anaerophila]